MENSVDVNVVLQIIDYKHFKSFQCQRDTLTFMKTIHTIQCAKYIHFRLEATAVCLVSGESCFFLCLTFTRV